MTPDQLKSNLSDLAAMSQKSKKAGQNIKAQAQRRLDQVRSRLDELKPKVITDQAAEDEYLALTEEAGRLQRIVWS